jgi:hypothetical protein
MTANTSTLPDFSPPANLPEFSADTRKIWSSDYISYWMTGEINADGNVVGPGRTKLKQYFNGTATAYDTQQSGQAVTWNAFPKLVTTQYKTTPLRWQVADASRQFQDEYLEWSVARDSSTKDILSASYTCEGPEYWSVFASYQKDDFIKTMRAMNEPYSEQMRDSDFFLQDPRTGEEIYNPSNFWNNTTTTGTIAHLVQPNNTLSAEIDIAAQATVLRKGKDGQVITDSDQLIRCSKYGSPGRHSDPTIGGGINSLAQSGSIISIQDPVGLYIHNVDLSNFKFDTAKTTGTASDEDLVPIDKPEEVFIVQRGDFTISRGLRFKVQVPEGRLGKNGQQLNVSNIWDTKTKQHIRYGAQIADYVTMGVTAVTIDGGKPTDPIPCYNPSAAAAVAPAPAALASIHATDGGSKGPAGRRLIGRHF